MASSCSGTGCRKRGARPRAGLLVCRLRIDHSLDAVIRSNITLALGEDLGDGDLTAALLPCAAQANAIIVAREPMIMAGRPWVDEVYRQIDPDVRLQWHRQDGDAACASAEICRISGSARSILSGERTALNFLQSLSATATVTARYVAAVAGTGATILDTRKTMPGLRMAQKYAVRCGGGENHRVGLFDAILIKENHILASGGIAAAIDASRKLHGDMPVEVEVESVDELMQALEAAAERILLDNFSIDELREAVSINREEGHATAELEASGGLTMENLQAVAKTGVDYISVGALTKNIRAIDLSMRFELREP